MPGKTKTFMKKYTVWLSYEYISIIVYIWNLKDVGRGEEEMAMLKKSSTTEDNLPKTRKSRSTNADTEES